MARHDVWRERGGEVLLLDCQSDLLSHLATRFVAPLLRDDGSVRIPRLQPIFELEGERYYMATHLAANIAARALHERVTSLEHEHDRIMAAFDMLLTGV